MLRTILAVALACLIVANIEPVNGVSGVTTFNDHPDECCMFSQGSGIFAAAMSDLSPLWVGARCQGTMDASKCDGRGSCVNCIGPACPDEQVCGSCFNVKCTGSLDGEVVGACSNRTIKVKIVDACPATHPANYCKIPQFGGTIRPQEACEAVGTNALDIATTARSQLSTFQGNLNIDIEPVAC